jgi:uncharacterized LabA/DUF88 family protein/cold shock CspA family protein
MTPNNLRDLVRIGIFYDGYYFYKVSNYYKYEHAKKARISISGLHTFIRSEAAKISGTDIKQCQIIDAHYFKGRSSAKNLGDKVQSERAFEDILMRENIVTHYLPLRFGQDNTMHEKGIDVWLALEAYEMALYKKFDIVALVVSDGDYVPLVRKLATIGVHVMLISWDFDYYNEEGNVEQTRTSQQLIEEVYHPVPMYKITEQFAHDDLVKNLFVQDREYYFTVSSAMGVERPVSMARPMALPPVMAPAPAGVAPRTPQQPVDEEWESVILSVNDRGFGFIEAPEINNVFFFYNSVVNADFNSLAAGTRVRYTRVEDPEKSKIDGQPRYRAGKVFVVDDDLFDTDINNPIDEER